MSSDLGAFLAGIPPIRRVGDYVHAANRLLNILLKRLWAEYPTERAAAASKQVVQAAIGTAARLPQQYQVTGRASRLGNLDLTTSKLFLTDPTWHTTSCYGPWQVMLTHTAQT